MLKITDKSAEDNTPPLLRLAFRPFFLLGSIYAVLAILIWLYAFQHGQPSQLQVPALWWHVHEMLFGFAMAIVVGFLLTAVQNWTGIAGTRGLYLAALVLLWLLPRVLFWTNTPLWLISSIEALFLLAAAYALSHRVLRTKRYKNLIFGGFLLLATVANFASYATIKGMPPFPSIAVWQAMLWWFVMLISIMGGRVIPFFSARRLNHPKAEPLLWLDGIANTTLLLLFILSFFPLTDHLLSTSIVLLAALSQLVRWLRWRPWLSLKEPLLWSLQLAYGCIPLALLIKGLAMLGLTGNAVWVSHQMIHILAIGVIAGLILAMIVRVSLGHTGREVYAGPSMWSAFAAIMLAALLRGAAVALWPQHLLLLVNLSGALWVAAFGLFVIKFSPLLLSPRADGHPG
ncbi:NnrS family protein [Agarivorans sp.]|uniref:NnrS family protein n=1 Tax=Agarivorans sp. TaxID=1872412 RepID=UPI003D02B46C